MIWIYIVAGLLIALLGARLLGRLRWRSASARLVENLRSHKLADGPAPLSAAALEGLPAPVARYLKLALGDALSAGSTLPGWVSLQQRGEMRLGEGPQAWKPFTATQNICARRPGFVWEAVFNMGPAMSVLVRDSYCAGEGAMQASMLGLLGIVNQHGTAQIGAASLQRWLAEAPWLPTALLPESIEARALHAAGAGAEGGGASLRWEGIDERRALALLRDGALEVSVEFRFNAAGEVESIYCPARFRDVKGTPVATPWEGRFSEYRAFDGLRIPTRAEVGWHIDGEYQPYWRGEIESASVS
ncbi:hypothetical protein IT575_10075 [bacterium]|nr:hypothetical protein [bacterium]